jgi:hypothetical protein
LAYGIRFGNPLPAGGTDTPRSPATRSASRRVVRSGSVSLERRPDPRSRRPRPVGSADLIQVCHPAAVSAAMRRNGRLGESLGQRVVPAGVGRRAQRSRRPRHRLDATAHEAPAAAAPPVPLITVGVGGGLVPGIDGCVGNNSSSDCRVKVMSSFRPRPTVDPAATVELGISGSGPGRKGEVGLKAPASEPIAAALHPS